MEEALADKFKAALETEYASTIGEAAGARWKVEQEGTSVVVTLYGRVSIPYPEIDVVADRLFTHTGHSYDNNFDEMDASEHWNQVTFFGVQKKG